MTASSAASKAASKEQYLVPYFISAHPGSDIRSMIDLAALPERNGYRPEQVQDFIPAPFDVAACMFHTGLDPFTKSRCSWPNTCATGSFSGRRCSSSPENYFMVRKILLDAGRKDLIGDGCDALIPTHPPRSLEARQRQAQRLASDGDSSTNSPDEDHYHSRQNPRPRLPPETTDGPTQVVFVGRAAGKTRQPPA